MNVIQRVELFWLGLFADAEGSSFVQTKIFEQAVGCLNYLIHARPNTFLSRTLEFVRFLEMHDVVNGIYGIWRKHVHSGSNIVHSLKLFSFRLNKVP